MQKGTKLPARWEDFLQAFSDKIAEASTDLPSTRCISRHNLSSIIAGIKQELELLTTFPSGVEVLSHLCAMGLASQVPVTDNDGGIPSKDFYLVGMSASHDLAVSPYEMLQAYNNDGVICYFSALSYYDLTTQLPTHHHIASIVKADTTNITSERERPLVQPITNIKKKKSIGTLAFSYDGANYYSTKRRSNTIPGTKRRIYNKRTILRITTIEQTLLDTLQYPAHCGGPEVVFEAWGNHIGKIDEGLLLNYLQSIDTNTLNRRVGALFELLDYKPELRLLTFLCRSKSESSTVSEPYDITLLRGINYTNLNPDWKVLTP